MTEHSLEFQTETDIQEEENDLLRPEIVYEKEVNEHSESNDSSFTHLGPLVEYVYDESQVQDNDHEYIAEEYLKSDIGIENHYFRDKSVLEDMDDENVIQPMMPFFLSSSPIFTIMNEDDEVGETIILQIENETEETITNKKTTSEPIPDEVRASTLQLLLCSSKSNTVIDTYTCEICSASYGCLNCLKSHYETMHLGNTIISQYKCKFATNITKALYCPVCELIFDTRNDTMDHYITHAVACDICGSGFDRQAYLTEHLKTAHSKGIFENFYECEICKLTYQYGYTLSKHYQNFHKIVLCVECNRKFENITDLQEHGKNHRQKLDVLPFACSKCDKAFAQISDIAVHIRQHHNHKRKMEQCTAVYAASNVAQKNVLRKTLKSYKQLSCRKKGKELLSG